MKGFLIPLLLLLSMPLYADYPLEIIELKSRQVEEVIPLIEPFIDRSGSIAGMNNQLIIRTSDENLQQIKQLLDQIDRPPRQLMIWVRQTSLEQVSRHSSQLGVDSDIGDSGRVRIGTADRNRANYRIRQSNTRREGEMSHRIQATEGYPAFITTGHMIPLKEHTTTLINGDLYRQESVRYQNHNSGFYVVPRLNGEIVTLAIQPKMTRPGERQGVYETQQASSVISGRLGEWITLGGVDNRNTSDRDAILSQAKTLNRDDRIIQVRVEAIKP